MDNKDASRTIRTGFSDRFHVSHDTWEVTDWMKAYIKGTWLDFCSYSFGILMKIHEFLELYSLYCICMRIYFAGIFSKKN